MPRAKLRALLKKADLESAGFTKTEETQIVTGEDGVKRKKEVTYYTVRDSCSNVSYWEEIIGDRLPTFSKALTKKVINEEEERIGNRATEHCEFGLEIHFKLCGHAEEEKTETEKRLWGGRRRRRRRRRGFRLPRFRLPCFPRPRLPHSRPCCRRCRA
jgi:hypothetical protein